MLLSSLDVKDILPIANAYFSGMTKTLILQKFVVIYVKEFQNHKNKIINVLVAALINVFVAPCHMTMNRWHGIKKFIKPSKKQGDTNPLDHLFLDIYHLLFINKKIINICNHEDRIITWMSDIYNQNKLQPY